MSIATSTARCDSGSRKALGHGRSRSKVLSRQPHFRDLLQRGHGLKDGALRYAWLRAPLPSGSSHLPNVLRGELRYAWLRARYPAAVPPSQCAMVPSSSPKRCATGSSPWGRRQPTSCHRCSPGERLLRELQLKLRDELLSTVKSSTRSKEEGLVIESWRRHYNTRPASLIAALQTAGAGGPAMAGCATRTSFAGHPGIAAKADKALTSNLITSWDLANLHAVTMTYLVFLSDQGSQAAMSIRCKSQSKNK